MSKQSWVAVIGRPWKGRSYSGTELPVFLEANNLKNFINKDLEVVLRPIFSQPKTGKPGGGDWYCGVCSA